MKSLAFFDADLSHLTLPVILAMLLDSKNIFVGRLLLPGRVVDK